MMELLRIVALVALGLILVPWLLKVFFTMLGLTVTFVAIAVKLAIMAVLVYVIYRAFKAVTASR